jgi:hypothetical protein
MIYLLVSLATCAVLLGATVLTALAAVHDEHLLVMYWNHIGTVFLEKAADGRYEGRGTLEVPGAVMRYAAGRVRGVFHTRLQPQPAHARRHVLFPAHKA